MSLVDLGKRLLEASKHGLTEEVRVLMSNGAPFTTDWLGTSPLHFASQFGHVTTAEVLLRAGISRDARTKVDRTPLHVAAQAGHSDIVDLLVRNGADIDAKDMLKMTPLHWAVEKGNIDVIQYLLQHGSETQSQNKFEKTPVDVALGNGRSDIAQLLQSRDAGDINGVATLTEQVIEEISEVTDQETVAAAQSVASSIETSTVESPVVTSGDGTQGGTAVLATLAALAEATANTDTAEQQQASSDEATLKWLESQGITMISADSSTIVANTVQHGNSLTLTEAGKLALNQMVKNKRIQDEDGNVLTIVRGQGDQQSQQVVVTLNPSDIGTQITTEEGLHEYAELPEQHFQEEEEDEEEEPSLKRIKMEPSLVENDMSDVAHSAHLNIKLEAADIIAESEEIV